MPEYSEYHSPLEQWAWFGVRVIGLLLGLLFAGLCGLGYLLVADFLTNR